MDKQTLQMFKIMIIYSKTLSKTFS